MVCGVVTVGEPRPWVVDDAGRALPLVRSGGGSGGARRPLGGFLPSSGERMPVPSTSMRVWIDQDLCTGDGLCTDHCPDVFTQLEDGIAYVSEFGVPLNNPGSGGSLANVPARTSST